MKKILSICIIFLGVGLITTAGFLFVKNQSEEQHAEAISQSIVQVFDEYVSDTTQVTQIKLLESPAVEIEGELYIGTLSIPSLELNLPVASSWSYQKLQSTPCVYSGNFSEDNLIIAAHNYSAHFGNIGKLALGDEVYITDVMREVHMYTLVAQESVDGSNLAGLYEGDWDLTLFTCLYGNNTQRVVLRFSEII